MAPAAVRPAPTPAFGGDCSVVATEQEVSSATGGQVTRLTTTLASDGDQAIRSLGGIRCIWNARIGQGVWVTVIPVAAAGADVVTDLSHGQPLCYSSDGGSGAQDACSFSRTVGEWWYAGVVYSGIGSGIAPTDAIDELVADFSARVSAHPAVISPPVDGAWASVPECEMQAAAVDTVAVLGEELHAVTGNSPGEAGPGFYGALEATGQRTCYWQSGDSTVEIGLLPGGGWVVDQMADLPGATALKITGVERAVSIPNADGSALDTLYLSDGSNVARVYGSFSDHQRGALGAAVMAALAR